MTGSSDSQERFDALAQEFIRRWLAGEQPSISEYAKQYPDLAEQIRFIFPLLTPRKHRRETDTPAAPTSPEQSDTDGSLPRAGLLPVRLGGYRIVREIGRGGMGVVYEAIEEDLGRHVALKVLPSHGGFQPVLLERFRREARAAARLHHTNIVPVFGIGEDHGVAFYAMQYIEGEPLNRVLEKVSSQRQAGPTDQVATSAEHDLTTTIAQRLCHVSGDEELVLSPTPLVSGAASMPASDKPRAPKKIGFPSASGTPYFRNVARIGMQVADALDHAHGRGILHRDIKPANLLLDTRGNVWVADFGLAFLEDAEELSKPGDVIGTVRYMAPERFEGVSSPQSDIYSLGATLFELLTLQPAFPQKNREQLIEQVVRGEVRPSRSIDPQVPRDLDTIVQKAMARELTRRYVSARELADDLGRFLRGEPIAARRVGWRERAVKWAKRRPAVAALLGACLTLFMLGLLLVTWQWRAARRAEDLANVRAGEAEGNYRLAEHRRQESDDARQRLRQALDRAEANSYYHAIALAHHEWLAGNPRRVEDILAGCPAELRHWEWHYLRGLCRSYLHLFRPAGGSFQTVAFSPDGALLALGDSYGNVQIRDAQTGQTKQAFRGLIGGVASLTFSPDGQKLAGGGNDGLVYVWDAATGKELRRMPGHKGWVNRVVFSPDGDWIASAGQDKTVCVWDARSGALRWSLRGHKNSVQSVVFRRDGTQLASGDWDGLICLWDAKQGKELRHWMGHAGVIQTAACSPTADEFATASQDRTICRWDWKTGEPIRTLHGHEDAIYCLNYSPDGKRLASAGADHQVRIWDLEKSKELFRLRGQERLVRSVVYSPDCKLLATCDDDGCKIWSADDVQEARPLRGHTNYIWGVAFSDDSRHVATASWDKTVKVWDVATATAISTLQGHTQIAQGVAFRPEAKARPRLEIATASWDKTVKLWDGKTGKLLATLEGHTGPVLAVAYTLDGRYLTSAGMDQIIRVWDADTGKPLRSIKGHTGPIFALAFSPDGKHFAAGVGGDAVRIWSLSGEEMLRLPQARFTVAYSPDGKHLATLDERTQVKIWDVKTGKEVQTLQGHQGTVPGLVYSPDGKRLFSVGHDRTLRVWERETGRELLNLQKHEKSLRALAISPDGQHVVSVGDEFEARLWTSTEANGK